MVLIGNRLGELEPVRIPANLIEVLDFQRKGSKCVGAGLQFFSVRVFPAGTEPDLSPKHTASKHKQGRPPGSSFAKADAKIAEEMHRRRTHGIATSATEAAQQVVDGKILTVKGAGTRESKVRRLVGRYRQIYPENAE